MARQSMTIRRPKPKLPVPINGLFVFVTAEDAARGLANGAAVNNWRDQSGFGYLGSQATSGRRPTINLTGGPLGGPCLHFDGVDDYLAFNNLSFPQPCTYFLVAKVTAGGGSKTMLASNDSNNQHAVVIDGTSSEQLGIYDGAALLRSSAGYAGEWHVFTHQAKPDPDLAWVDGVQVISGASGSGNSGQIRIGADSGGGNCAPADVCLLAAYYRVVSTSERDAVHNYLFEHYGVLGARPLGRRYYFGGFSDSPLSVGDPVAFFDGIAALGLDSAIFTNGSSGRVETLAAAADARGIPIFIGDLEELAANPSSDIAALVKLHRQHRSVQGYYIKDEPDASEATQLGTWASAYRAADPTREAFAVLIGTDRVGTVYTGAGFRLLVIDVYPFGVGNGAMDTTMSATGSGGYSFDMPEYLRQVLADRNPLHPFYVILQTHGGGLELRVPSAAELNLEYWIATSWGANGVFWFIWETEDFWQGYADPSHPLRGPLMTLAAELTGDVRSALMDVAPAVNEWQASNGAVVRTLARPDPTGQFPGARRYPVVYNPTTATISTALTPLNPPDRNLLNLRTGASLPATLGTTYTLDPGHGLVFQTDPETAAVGVPDVPIDWTQTPTQRRLAHPFNDPAWEIELHPLGSTVTVGMTWDQIQAVYDGLPLGVARVEWQAGTYTIPTTNPLRLYGRSNLHNVAVGGTVTITPGGTPPAASTTATDYRLQNIFIGPGLETLEGGASPYANYNAGVDSGSNSPIPWLDYYHNPSTDIYWDGFTFDGAGRLSGPLTGTSWRRVLFRRCRWTNLRDSYEASAGADGFHYGSLSGNTRMEQVSFLDCTFDGPGRWVLYLDGAHGGVIARNTIAGSNYGSGGFVMLTNDDFSYSDTITAHVATTNDEIRSARYQMFWSNTFNGNGPFQILSYSGGDLLFDTNTVGQCNLLVGITARGSNKWAPISGLVMYHFGNRVVGNTVGSITGDGLQGLVNGGASHCGKDNSPASFWDPASGGTRTYWGRVGSGIDPLVPGTTRQTVIRDNVVTSGPTGMVLLNPDNIAGEAGPAGTFEGSHDIGGNTRNGVALT